ncbi:MAG: adenylate/guanylate cyclase domain-containing protein [Pseudomonadota bacterium]
MERRLAAILAADVVGYSKMMAEDEVATLTLLKGHRAEVFDPKVHEHGGRIIKLMGDGTLVEFPSIVDAVKCALAIQMAQAESQGKIRLRIGINLGDIISDGEDIYGDGVNIAARLEAIAEPGGICVSEQVHQNIRANINAEFSDMGERILKNIDHPVNVWGWAPEDESLAKAEVSEPLKLPDKPSIAVLPFDNMSGDPEQEYFADGIVEDIITAFSRMKWLFVIARNSSFTYKGRAVDIKQVGRELGVRYVLEGSVRKSGNRIRITGQLIDTSNGTHIWADRFDGEVEDIFDLQDRVTQNVVGTILPKLEQAEIDRTKHKSTESLDAYDYYLRGVAEFNRFEEEANGRAIEFFMRAIELDPDYAAAYGMAARSHVQRKGFGWIADLAKEKAEALRLARIAARLGKDDAIALAAAGFTMSLFGEVEDGDVFMDQAISRNSNIAWAWHVSGMSKAAIGQPEIVVKHAEHAMRLSPQDPQQFAMKAMAAIGYYFTDQFEEAYKWADGAMREQPRFLLSSCVAAASAAILGRESDASRAVERMLAINPDMRMSNLDDWFLFKSEREHDLWHEGLRKAGLPE